MCQKYLTATIISTLLVVWLEYINNIKGENDMAKKYYDENGNEVKVKQKRGGCLKWLLYGFILMILLGACGALLDDGEEEEQIPEETVEKEKDDSDEEKSEPAENDAEDEEEYEYDFDDEE